VLKAIVYLGLTAVGVVGTLFNPFIGVVACLEAYLMNPTTIPMPDGGLRYQFWTTVAFLASCLLHRAKGVDRVGREGFVLKALWLFVAIGALSSLWAVVNPQLALDTIYEVFKTVLLTSLLVRAIQSEKHMRIALIACLVGVAHASILHTFGVRYGYIPASFGRELGLLPDNQTTVEVFFVPLMLMIAVTGSKIERLFCWCILPFVLNSIVTSYMRAGLVSLAVELALIVVLLKPRLTRRLVPVLAAGLILFVFRLTPENYWQWMSTIKTPTEEASANLRFYINQASWRMFSDHPMGVGYRNYIEISPKYFPREYLDPANGKRAAHNSFLTVLCETGIFGFAAFMSAFGGTVWLLRRIRKTIDPSSPSRVAVYAIGLEIGLYGWAVAGLFHSEHEVDPAYWAIAFAVILTRLHRESSGPSDLAGDGGEPSVVANPSFGSTAHVEA